MKTNNIQKNKIYQLKKFHLHEKKTFYNISYRRNRKYLTPTNHQKPSQNLRQNNLSGAFIDLCRSF